MSKAQINFRASDLTGRQLETLTALWGTSQTETISVAIDRIYQQEEPKMLETLLKKYNAHFHWNGSEWFLSGTDHGNAWETDNYEAASEEQARNDAVDYLLEYNN
mgnify:CR=1 FL=1